jgi:hypothetical protein
LGQNKGLIISQDNYIKNINVKPNFDNVVTRLHVYGQDNLSINSLNPTGTSYIEIYQYYKTIEYMSQGLIDALNVYDNKVASYQSQYTNYVSQLTTLNAQLETYNNKY